MKIETWRMPAILLLFVSISLITRWLSLCVDILDLDEAGHIVGSWQLLDGKLLYTDFIDNKPPLLYVYYAFAQILFGRGMFSVHLFTVLFTVPVTALALYSFFNRTIEGLCAALIFLFYSAAFLAHDMLAANTELLMILPATWGLAFINTAEKARQAGRVAMASFLIGIGVLFKHQISFWLFAVAAAITYECIRDQAYKRLVTLGVISTFSFFFPLILTYALFSLAKGADAFFHWTVTNNFAYADNPISWKEATGRASSYLLPFLLVTAPLWYYAMKWMRLQALDYRRVFLFSLLLVSIPPALIGFRFFPHYFIQLYIPLSLAAAPYVTMLFSKGKTARFVIYSTALLIVSNIVNFSLYFGGKNVYRERDPVYQNVAAALRNSPCYQGANLFVWGYAPMFYYYTKLPPASRFALLSHGGLTSYVPGNLESVRSKKDKYSGVRKESWQLLFGDLERNHCTYILDTAPAAIYRWDEYPLEDYPQLYDYVVRNFERESTIDQVVIYRRRKCALN